MSNWRLVRLDFGRSPVHFGEVGIGIEESSERVRSDTLFSGWVNAYVRLFNVAALESLFARFPIADSNNSENLAPVRFSSTFIYTENSQSYTYYLPRPNIKPQGYPPEDLAFFKAYKKLKYLPLDVWQRWYQGSGISDRDIEELTLKTKVKETNGDLNTAGVFDYSKTYQTATYPKVSIDRRTAATNFYHTGFTQFNCDSSQRSGLYFLINFPQIDAELEDRLHAALNLLGENGLGGERSSGAGRFAVEYWRELSSKWQDLVNFSGSEYHCLLSLFWRESIEENFLDNSSYELIERGGWIGSPFSGRQLRRKKVYMFAEGSVFTSPPAGQLAVVTPDGFNKHPIYRSGISLSLPINIQSKSS